MRCLNLLETLQDGMIHYRGEIVTRGRELFVDADEHRRRIGMVFQEFNLWPNKTLLSNLTQAPRSVLRTPRRKAEARARDWLNRVGLSGLEERYPNELSGGQRQRGAIARALMMDPEVLLLDEITSSLDVETTARLLDLLEELRSPERAMVFVSHHLNFVERATDRTAVLIGGFIVEQGPSIQLLAGPRQSATRNFLQLVKETA